MAIIRSEQELCWKQDFFVFNDFVGISYFKSALDGDHLKTITVPNYFQSMLSNICSEKLVRNCKSQTGFEKLIHFFGALCLYESLGLSDEIFLSFMKRIRRPVHEGNGDIAKWTNRFCDAEGRICNEYKESVSAILKKNYNNRIVKSVWVMHDLGDLNINPNVTTISEALKQQCKNMSHNGFSSKYLKIDKTQDNASIRIHPFQEASKLITRIKYRVYKFSTLAEINRLAFCFGIYVISDMIAYNLVDLLEKEVCDVIESLENLYLIHYKDYT